MKNFFTLMLIAVAVIGVTAQTIEVVELTETDLNLMVSHDTIQGMVDLEQHGAVSGNGATLEIRLHDQSDSSWTLDRVDLPYFWEIDEEDSTKKIRFIFTVDAETSYLVHLTGWISEKNYYGSPIKVGFPDVWISVTTPEAPPPDTTTSIEETDQWALKVYPNPATNYLTVNVKEGVVATVMDMTGKEMNSYQLTSSGNHQIAVSDLARGVYILHLTNGEEYITTRFVKK